MIIYSYIEVLHEVSGVQKVLLDIHNGLKKDYQARIASYLSYEEIKHYFDIPKDEYVQIRHVYELNHSIIITHERKASSRCCLYNKLPWFDVKLIHVQHSVYANLKLASLYPNIIVSISDKVTQNLIDYFGISTTRIYKIHNGIKDCFQPSNLRVPQVDNIKIAYIARIDNNKRQIEIVKNLKGKLHPSIHIDFIGNGPLVDELNQLVCNDSNFRCLGYCNNINELLPNYDYVMLYSIKEGLPITLIEGCMHGKPLIVNDAGGNFEIGIKGKNAFHVFSWNNLLDTLNNLCTITDIVYKDMSEYSRLHYLQEFEYNSMIRNYKYLIDSILLNGKK